MIKKLSIALAVLLSTFVLSAPSVYATGSNNGNPAGNNGFVKINDEEAPDSIPNNHPHVSCTFSVDFYNYDKGDYKANVLFELQAPTNSNSHKLTVKSGNLNPFIGGDVAGGGTDLDASEKYTLGFTGTPHDKQGYHVKLTVQAPGSKGSDKKHKVFWVEPCKTSTTTPSTTTPNSSSNQQVLGANTPGELPVTGATTTSMFVASAVMGAVAYIGHLAFLRRKASL